MPPGPRATEIVARDAKCISPSYTRPYPFVMDRGEGAVAIDVDGNRYLDFTAGIAVASTGHSHPKVVEAIVRQAGKFLHMSGTDFYYELMVTLAEKLIAHMPGSEPHKVYFGNSGTEAIEAALKMARYRTGRSQFIAFYGSFHGRTMGALALTASKSVQKENFFPMLPGVHHVEYPNCYRCPYQRKPDDCCLECLRQIEDVLFRHTLPAQEVAAIFVEPVQGEGGYLVAPPRFLPALQDLANKHGILLVLDEIQSGMGRTGKMFGFDLFGIEPDIVALAKGIASGLPLSATIAKAEVMNWKPGAHASTFGGNPVSIAAALATLELLEAGLMENAAKMGEHLMARMSDWPKRFSIVGDVRGLGLMIGIELVKNQSTKERALELRDRLVTLAFERGLLLLGCGQNTVRLCPPLVIDRDQADSAVDTLEQCLRTLAEP